MRGVCPVCNGTCRVPVPEEHQKWKKVVGGYDSNTDTFPCSNCGGQYMFSKPKGEVDLRPDGTPCKHSYIQKTVGNCLNEYTCTHCNDTYQIDSGD